MTHRYALLRMLSLMLIVLFIGSGCSVFKKKKETPETAPVEQMYEKAHASMKRANWSAGAANFRALVAQYPYGPHTEQALIETAYAQYKMGSHEEAISSIDRFIRTYPTHRNIAYLYYLRGLVNSSRDTVFLQKVWKLDSSRRDLATPHQAYNDFSIVVERYPNSRYAADARKRMAELQNTFARHELEVALYNLRRTAYVASVERASYLLETYPDSKYKNDAIAALAAAYTGLGNEQLASDTRARLQQVDPGHPYLSGNWPKFPGDWRKLNPFAREKSAVDY